jgi:hypothetical protein
MSNQGGVVKNAPAWLSAATADKAMAYLVIGAVLLVIILLARANGRLARLARVAAAPVSAPKPSGGGGKLLLAGLAGAGGWLWYESKHKAAIAAKGAPAPPASPSPRPTVTQTVTPHVTGPVHQLLTGGDIVTIYVIAGIVAIVIVGAVLRRSS